MTNKYCRLRYLFLPYQDEVYSFIYFFTRKVDIEAMRLAKKKNKAYDRNDFNTFADV